MSKTNILIIIGIVLLVIIGFFFLFFSDEVENKEISNAIGLLTGGAAIMFTILEFKRKLSQDFENQFQSYLNDFQDFVYNIREEIKVPGEFLPNMTTSKRFFTLFICKLKKCHEDKQFISSLSKEKNIPEVNQFLKDGVIKDFNGLKFHISMLQKENLTQKPSFELQIYKFEYYYKQDHNTLRPYFEHLYMIFQYVIDKKRLNSKEYINRILAKMSNDELGVLFYYALSEYRKNREGKYQFKEWLEKYNFFENMGDNSLMHKNDSKCYNIDYTFI